MIYKFIKNKLFKMGVFCQRYQNPENEKEINFGYIKELNDERIPSSISFEILPNIIEQKNKSVCKIVKKNGTSGTGIL